MAKNHSGKMAILCAIKENKSVLFGQFSNTLTKQQKQQEWEKIAEIAKAVGIMPADKQSMYVRDTIWQNMRKMAMNKLDNSRRTGTGGGKDAKLTDIDNLVLDILGKESPTVVGLGVPDSIEEPIQPEIVIHGSGIFLESLMSTHDDVNLATPVDSGSQMPRQRPSIHYETTTATPHQTVRLREKRRLESVESSRQEKMELQIVFLKLKIEKTKLETEKLKLEIKKLKKELDGE